MPKLLTLVWICVVMPAVSQDFDEAEDLEAASKKAEKAATEYGRKVLETGRVMTLVNAEVIPGGCWDYANAVYDRAGFSSGKRETVYKAAKAGPYADLSQVKGGDWLYYVNHSYGGIEHSAIFVDWIDVDQKIGLMLSYGGENRRQPARYLPYDLSSVYGITRPNSQLGGTTTAKKTTTAAVDGRNQKSIDGQKTASATMKEVSGVRVGGMKVESLKFGTNVSKMEIVGASKSFSGATGRVYCWMRVSGGQGRAVTVKWYHNGAAVGDTRLDIRYNPMRTYAYRTVSGRPGTWTVEVVDPSGTVLHSESFSVK